MLYIFIRKKKKKKKKKKKSSGYSSEAPYRNASGEYTEFVFLRAL